jgi:voltage-gated potassium channel
MDIKLDKIVTLFMRLMSITRIRFIIELTFWFLLVWLGCAVLVYEFEVGINTRIQSLTDAVYVLLVTMTTSGDAAVVPITAGGRWVVSFAVIVSKLLTALLCAVAAALLIDHKLKMEMGLKMHALEKHIVILGWNLKGAQIIATLRNDKKFEKTPLLVMADIEQKPVDDVLVYFTRAGSPIRGEAIQRACLDKAQVVIILANYGERSHADALSAVNCLMARKVNPNAQIIAELLDPNQRVYLDTAGANAVISIGDVGGFLLAEAALGSQETQQLLKHVTRRT